MTRPSMLAPVVSVLLVRAMIFPPKTVSVPRVAEEPTCQKTSFYASAPFKKVIEELAAVVNVLSIRKTYGQVVMSV